MEYYQLTINDWLSMKQKLQAELLGVRRSFVRIGYMLRKIDEAKGYEHDGYKSIAEWAKGEYGLEGSTVSRFMAINREYSIGGFSEELLPEFEDFKRSQLEEMLKLPMADRAMITPDTPRADIRELKTFNKQKVEGVADDIEEFLEKFIEDNWDLAVELEGYSGDVALTKETFIPSGNRSYRKGLFFLMASENKVSIKKYGGQPEDYTWQQFTQILSDIFEERGRRENEERLAKKDEPEDDTESDAGIGDTREDTVAAVVSDGAERTRTGIAEDDSMADEEATNATECSEEPNAEENEKKKEEAVAPAQKVVEAPVRTERKPILEEEKIVEKAEPINPPEEQISGQMEVSDFPELMPERLAEQMNPPVEGPYTTRKAYLDSLTEYGAAEYMAQVFRENKGPANQLFASGWEQWFAVKVDERGREIE